MLVISNDDYKIIQPLVAVYGELNPTTDENWNSLEYIKIRQVLKELGYNVCKVSALHAWHRKEHMLEVAEFTKEDRRELIVISSNNKLWLQTRPTGKVGYKTFDLSKSVSALVDEIKYFFGDGSQDY